MESRRQYHKHPKNKGVIFVIVLSLIFVAFTVAIFLNITGKKQELLANSTSSSFQNSTTHTTSSGALTSSSEALLEDYKFAVDFTQFSKGTMFTATYLQTSFTLQYLGENQLILTGSSSNRDLEKENATKLTILLRAENIPQKTISMQDSGVLKSVNINTLLKNVANNSQDESTSSFKQQAFLEKLQVKNDPIYAYYKKSGNIALAFQSLDSNHYIYVEFQKNT